jgi:HAD superfamily hydrolase (TIGR01509 family)
VAIEAVVFDMDGLMLDTEPIYKVAWQAGCRELGYELTDATYSTLVGRPTPACEQVLLHTLGADFPLDRFRTRWPSIWQDTVARDGIQQKPGLQPLLAFLRSRSIRMAVATSSEAHLTEFSLGQAGLTGAFHAVVTGDQIEQGKPAPDIYLAAAAQLGVAAECCVALEDSEAGTVAASSAGMVTLLIPDWVPPTAIARQAANQVFPSLFEAHAFIETQILTTEATG